jgi:predicted RNA-binding Zn ribbon-like protein
MVAHVQHTHKSSTATSPISTIELLGGRLCLDFVNTLDPRCGPHPRDFLTSYADLVEWGRHIGILSEQQQQQLLHIDNQQPEQARLIFERAVTLREAIYSIFLAFVHAEIPQRADLEVLETQFRDAMDHAQLVPTSEGLEWRIGTDGDKLEYVLWLVARSTVELLNSEEVRKVKECPGLGDCGWLFLDTSKNGTRQWCSMQGCGSRSKMRRQYARKRAAVTK